MKQIMIIAALILTIVNGVYADPDITPKGEISSGDIHKTRCITLDRDNKPDGGEFVVEADKKTLLASIRVTQQSPLLEVIRPFNSGETTKPGQFKFELCKRDNVREFSLSYKICGINLTVGRADKDDPEYEVSSKFNLGLEVPSFRDKITIGDYVRWIKHRRHIADQLLYLKMKSDVVGYIFPSLYGYPNYADAILMQCESLSDTSIVVEDANH
ncbi:MAG: hypothetical protein WCW52_11020 [Elusimicrobiales bacterium]|jgi:hypothetical protein